MRGSSRQIVAHAASEQALDAAIACLAAAVLAMLAAYSAGTDAVVAAIMGAGL